MTSALDGGEWSASRPGRTLPLGKGSLVPIGQEAGWAPELVWTQRTDLVYVRQLLFVLNTSCKWRTPYGCKICKEHVWRMYIIQTGEFFPLVYYCIYTCVCVCASEKSYYTYGIKMYRWKAFGFCSSSVRCILITESHLIICLVGWLVGWLVSQSVSQSVCVRVIKAVTYAVCQCETVHTVYVLPETWLNPQRRVTCIARRGFNRMSPCDVHGVVVCSS
jgi:hypothetical protein